MSNTAKNKSSNRKLYYIAIVAILLLISVFTYNLIKPEPTENSVAQVTVPTEKKSNNAYANISHDDIQFIGSEGDYIWDTKDPYYGYDKLPIVVLVHVDSIDGGRNYSPIFEQYVYPQTIGKMTVLEVYKGDIKPGEQINYSRLGGIITFEEYWDGLSEAQKDKMLYLNNGKKPNDTKYIQEKFLDDIDIEVGKDYVVYLLPQTTKDGKYKEYFIDGMQHGLREAKGYVNGSNVNMTVLDNKTGEWGKPSSLLRDL